MKNTNGTLTKIPTASEIADAITLGLNNIKDTVDKIGGMIVAAVEAHPKGASAVYAEIQKANPSIHYNMIGTFEKVGRKTIYSPLLFNDSPATRRLLELPFSQQKELYDNPIKVVRHENGKNIVEEKRIQHLTPQETKVLFAEDKHVRTLDEQIKVVSQAKPTGRSAPAQRYRIDESELVVLEKTRFTISNLQEILDKMQAQETRSLETNLRAGQIKKR